MTEKYRELNLALEFLDAIDTTELSEENAGNVIEAHGYLSTWLEDNTELPQQFEVGEYVLTRTLNNCNSIFVKLERQDGVWFYGKAFRENTKHFFDICEVKTEWIERKLTDDEIATFKRAEHFAKHGRKLDEFRVGDIISYLEKTCLITTISDKFFTFGMVSSDRQVFLNNPNDFKYCELIKTAEELEGVE